MELLRKIFKLPITACRFVRDFLFFYQLKDDRLNMKVSDIRPIYDGWKFTDFDRHYIYHTSWAARVVKQIDPEYHVDISSSLSFCTILSAFIPVHFYDYRPADLELSGLLSGRADLLNLSFPDGSLPSVSCMHVIEHIGLGRYGDKLDWEGDIKAINELKRVVMPGGSLLIVVPVGREGRIHFNAHRVYHPRQINNLFTDDYALQQFCIIREKSGMGGILIDPEDSIIFAETYACGCFWFKRLK